MEPMELQPRLTQETLLEIYVQTLQDMGTHNEAIDRITGKWQELHERRRAIARAKATHAAQISRAQAAGKALRRTRRRHAILKRIKLLRNSAKPKLP
jgi:hypothetical protein